MTVSYFTSVILKTTTFTISSQHETLYELKYITFSLFTHRVYNQEHEDVKLEFDDLDAQPLSVNAELISALRPATIVFDADVVAELT